MAYGYAGAWKRRTLAGGPNPNLGGQLDPRHLTPVEPDPAVPMPDHALPVTRGTMFALDDFALPMTVQLDATPVLDRSPEDHRAGAAPRGGEARSHMQDDGGPARAHFYQPAITREADATYRTERIEMSPAVSQSRGQLVQGIDRDGPSPQGHFVSRWIDRRVTRRTITPDSYPLWPYRAAVPKQSPAPLPGKGNQYTSPFARIGSPKKRRIATPQIRRQPPAYADQETVDGVTAGAAPSQFWEF